GAGPPPRLHARGSPEDAPGPRPRRGATGRHRPGRSEAAGATLTTAGGAPAARRIGRRVRCDARLLSDPGSGRARGSLRRAWLQRPWIQTLTRSRSPRGRAGVDRPPAGIARAAPGLPIRRGVADPTRRPVSSTGSSAALEYARSPRERE